MKGFTTLGSINRLEKEVDELKEGSGLEVTAESVTYDNTESHLTADDVQAAIDELAGGVTAESVTYDNTSSGLTADDVQEAIDELEGAISDLKPYVFSTDEIEVGSYFGTPLYQKSFSGLSTATNGANWVTIAGITISDLDQVLDLDIYRTASGNTTTKMPLGEAQAGTEGSVKCSVVGSGFDGTITSARVTYTKVAPAENTRKKTTKK